MLSVKQKDIKYYFLSLWYDSTWDWTLVSQAIGEHFTHKANEPVALIKLIFMALFSVAIRRDLVSLLRFPFLLWDFACLSLEMSIQFFFIQFLSLSLLLLSVVEVVVVYFWVFHNSIR